jgi:hypothetical protein
MWNVYGKKWGKAKKYFSICFFNHRADEINFESVGLFLGLGTFKVLAHLIVLVKFF